MTEERWEDVLAKDVRPENVAPNGYLHAGAVVTLADVACGFGCLTVLPDEAATFTTIELKTNFLRTSGEGTIVTGSDIENVRPLAADNELVTTVVGPGSNATLKKPAQSRKVKAGDVIIIPAGLYHGFSEVPDHIEYVLVRPDVEKVLPAGYVNPALKK